MYVRALGKLQAKMKTPEGMVYDGEFVNGVPHGKVSYNDWLWCKVFTCQYFGKLKMNIGHVFV